VVRKRVGDRRNGCGCERRTGEWKVAKWQEEKGKVGDKSEWAIGKYNERRADWQLGGKLAVGTLGKNRPSCSLDLF